VDTAKNPELEGYIISDEALYKFAELLIEECGDFTDKITRNLMKKHFGVE
jgi:hypothetical protein